MYNLKSIILSNISLLTSQKKKKEIYHTISLNISQPTTIHDNSLFLTKTPQSQRLKQEHPKNSSKTQITLAERSSILTSDSGIKGNVEREQDGAAQGSGGGEEGERGEMCCELGDRSVALICMHSSWLAIVVG